jgi:hypothetical protein
VLPGLLPDRWALERRHVELKNLRAEVSGVSEGKLAFSMIVVKFYAFLNALETDTILFPFILRFWDYIIVLGTLISNVIELAHL